MFPAASQATPEPTMSVSNYNQRRHGSRGGCPALALFARAGIVLPIPWVVMPSGLHRTYGAHHLHFITCSCYRRLPFLGSPQARDRFVTILEQTRQRYRFVVVGYVVMPEHFHLLISEPEVGNPSTVMQVLKQRTARALLPKKKRRHPRGSAVCLERSPVGRFGRHVSMTSMYGRVRNGWRSYDTCIVTR